MLAAPRQLMVSLPGHSRDDGRKLSLKHESSTAMQHAAYSNFTDARHTIPLRCEPATHGDPAADWERLDEEARSPCAAIFVELHHLQRAAVSEGLVQRDVPFRILLICNSA